MKNNIRSAILSALFLLPEKRRAAVSSWIRGRDELRKLKKADYVFVTCPKSGRTWLRIMISRILQQRHGLPVTAVIGSTAFNRNHPSLPNVCFTHDTYIAAYTGNHDTKKDYYGKRIVLLVRDPRDITVSSYFQWKYRMDKQKKAIHAAHFEDRDLSIFEYTMHQNGSLQKTIALMNSWHNAIPELDHFMLIRYENLRSDPAEWLYRIAKFINLEPTIKDVEDAVQFASIERMKHMEREQSFGAKGRRFGSGKQSSNDAYKVRRGKVGGYRDYFTQDQLSEINSLVNSTLAAEYGYR